MAHQRRNPSALHDPKISIVIPVYNEKSTIDEILRRVLDTEVRKEVIVVDDCSSDGTRQILENMAARQAKGDESAPAQDGSDKIALRDLRFFFQAPNQGKGAALRRGFAQATGEIVLVQDADLEYDPRDYAVMLEPIIDGRADVVYGSRFLGGPQRGCSSSRTGLDSNLRLRRRLRSTSGASTKCRLLTRGAPTKKERRLPGKMASKRCGASSVINSATKLRR